MDSARGCRLHHQNMCSMSHAMLKSPVNNIRVVKNCDLGATPLDMLANSPGLRPPLPERKPNVTCTAGSAAGAAAASRR